MRLAALTLLVVACSDQSLTYKREDPVVIDDGSITGRVCDPSGRTWLPDAEAYVNITDGDGVIIDTQMAFSDVDGYWHLNDLPGDREYTVYVQYGPDLLQQETVWVGSGEDVELDEPDCFDPLAIDVAIVTGDYDDFDQVLIQMGFANFQLIDGLDEATLATFLDDPDELAKYDIIFFNGGFVEDGVIYDTADSTNTAPAQRIQNIVNYVDAGGTIYASDWAYNIPEMGWPDAADFVGADEVPDDAQMGDYEEVHATVSDVALSEFLGEEYVDVTYDLPVWAPVQNVSSSVSTHLTGTVPYSDGLSEYTLTAVPLLYSFNSGDGKVVYSTFRVARNADDDVVAILQYMMYRL
jgi:hypothetical protein